MKTTIALLAFLLGSTAFAYEDGTYRCKHTDSRIPDNVYVFKTVDVQGDSVPFVKLTRYHRGTGSPGSPIIMSEIKGFTVLSTYENKEIHRLGELMLQFVDGKLGNCVKQ